MSSWNKIKLGDIAQIKGGKRLPAGSDFAEGITPYPYLRVLNMIDGSISDTDMKYVTHEVERLITNYKISKSDLYVTIAGTLGNFGIVPNKHDDAQLTENAAKITGINCSEFEQLFLKYYLNSNSIKIQINREIGVGGGVPKLALHRIEKLIIEYPSITEQKKIAKILSKTDSVIEKTEMAIAKYEAIKQGMMHDLFTRGLDENGKLRPRCEEAPHLYQETELGWVPRNWEVKPLGDYLQYISYGFTNPMPETEDGPYMITAANIYGGKIQVESTRRTSNEAYGLLTDKSKPRVNDILITKDGTLGRLAIVTLENVCINQSVAVMRVKENQIPIYFKLMLESEYYQKKILLDSGGSTIKHIYITKIDKMMVVVPKEQSEQKLISEKVITINKLIQDEEKSLYKYRSTKYGLMSDLLTGKVRVEIED